MYGGDYSLTDAIASERDGITKAIFRRKLVSTDGYQDHDITNEAMHVIWAIGQTPGASFHSPASSIEAQEASNTNFYQPDDIKYHGTRNRGSTQINFFTADSVSANTCRGSYQASGCNGNSCPYKAEWVVSGDSVRFRITAQTGGNRWTGIGFSDNTMMANSDIVVGASDGSNSFVSDMFATGRTRPPVDASQDISDMSIATVNGMTVMMFTRPIVSTDANDIGLDQDRFFLFPTVGGPVTIASRQIGYHTQTPIISGTRVSLPRPGQCSGGLVFEAQGGSSALVTVPSLLVLLVAALSVLFI
jgi:hypothetical protein